MFHKLPSQGSNLADHCFYFYQADFFISLARANGYELLGMWGTPVWNSAFAIPWSGDVQGFSSFPSKHIDIAVLYRKVHDNEFFVPYQSKYESSNDGDNAARYHYVVDGEIVNGAAIEPFVAKRKKKVKIVDTPPLSIQLENVTSVSLISIFLRTLLFRVQRKLMGRAVKR